MQDRVEPHLSSIMRAMPDAIQEQAMSSSPDRAETLVQIRAELRDNHPRLTDVQIDLIADVAVDLRMRNASGRRSVPRLFDSRFPFPYSL